MALVGWFLAALFVAEFWWVIAAILIVTVTLVLVRRARHRRAIVATALAQRADEQHRWALGGDPRGTYGMFWPADPYPDEPEADTPPGFAKRKRDAKRPPNPWPGAQSRPPGRLMQSVIDSDRVRVQIDREVAKVGRRLEQHGIRVNVEVRSS